MLAAVALVVIGVVDVLGFSLVLATVVRRLSSVCDFGFTYKWTNLSSPYLHGGWMLALRMNWSSMTLFTSSNGMTLTPLDGLPPLPLEATLSKLKFRPSSMDPELSLGLVGCLAVEAGSLEKNTSVPPPTPPSPM